MIVGVSILYDESPIWIQSAITSFAQVCDAFVIVDGAYWLYPGSLDKPKSDIDMHIAILEAARTSKKPVTLYVPSEPFFGNEVEKRNLSLDLARQVPGVDEDSWFLVFDGDFTCHYGAEDLEDRLNESNMLVAEYGLNTVEPHQANKDAGHGDLGWSGESSVKLRCLYKNIPELAYGPAHYCVSGLDPDSGEFGWLWGNPTVHQPYATAFDASHLVKVEHRHHLRIQARNAAAKEFYDIRDESGIEAIGKTYIKDLSGEYQAV